MDLQSLLPYAALLLAAVMLPGAASQALDLYSRISTNGVKLPKWPTKTTSTDAAGDVRPDALKHLMAVQKIVDDQNKLKLNQVAAYVMTLEPVASKATPGAAT